MDFRKTITRWGRGGILVFGAAGLLPPLFLWLFWGIIPSPSVIMNGWLQIIAIYWVFYLVEPLQYYPIMGLSGVYMGYMAGNIPGMRLPAMLSAQKVLKVEQGTEKGEVVATIAIASSVVVGVIVMTLAALIGQQFLEILPVYIQNSFDHVLPATIGAVLGYYIFSYPGVIGILLVACLIIVRISMPSWCYTPLAIIIGIGLAVSSYQRKKKKEGAEK